METWTFDRAGAYSGEAFDITQEPHRFQNILAAYLSMNDDELSSELPYQPLGDGFEV